MCAAEQTDTVRLLLRAISIEPGQLCHTVLPSLQMLVEGLRMNTTTLTDTILEAFIGDPSTYNVHSDWYSETSFFFSFIFPWAALCAENAALTGVSTSIIPFLYNLLNSITEWSRLLHFTELTTEDLRVLRSAKSDSYSRVVWGQQAKFCCVGLTEYSAQPI